MALGKAAVVDVQFTKSSLPRVALDKNFVKYFSGGKAVVSGNVSRVLVPFKIYVMKFKDHVLYYLLVGSQTGHVILADQRVNHV
jgi:hypothetical protein